MQKQSAEKVTRRALDFNLKIQYKESCNIRVTFIAKEWDDKRSIFKQSYVEVNLMIYLYLIMSLSFLSNSIKMRRNEVINNQESYMNLRYYSILSAKSSLLEHISIVYKSFSNKFSKISINSV